MNTFSITTLGCKVNQYESQQIREFLEQLGLTPVDTSKRPDLAIINTCCVTHTASAKSRQYIRRARRLCPDAVIVVSGCLPTVQIGELGNLDENVNLILHRDDIVDTLIQIVNPKTIPLNYPRLKSNNSPIIIKAENGGKIKYKNTSFNSPPLPLLSCFKGHTRAFLNIQDGCDGFCSYCIVPKTRPYLRSKPPHVVLKEAQALVKAGHKEIVITGVFLGAYGQKTVIRKNWPAPQNDKLSDLLDKIAKIPNLARIRISSLEPADVTQRLLDTFGKYRKIMPHLHLSLQSGSNNILKSMRRQYTLEEFKDKVQLIKSRLDRPAITTDIIVGFPGETDADFEKTIELAEEIGFAKMHIFKFSPRKGTAAASMQNMVNNRVIKERSKLLRDLNIALSYKFRQQFLGETAEILIENSDGHAFGRSERYFMVYLEKTEKRPEKNKLVRVKLIENSKDGMIGKIIQYKNQQVKGVLRC